MTIIDINTKLETTRLDEVRATLENAIKAQYPGGEVLIERLKLRLELMEMINDRGFNSAEFLLSPEDERWVP